MTPDEMIRVIEWNMTWTIRAIALKCWPPLAMELNELARVYTLKLKGK